MAVIGKFYALIVSVSWVKVAHVPDLKVSPGPLIHACCTTDTP